MGNNYSTIIDVFIRCCWISKNQAFFTWGTRSASSCVKLKLRILSFDAYQVPRHGNMTTNANRRMITTMFNELTKNKELRSKWIIDELIVIIIQHVSKTKQIEIHINKKTLNSTIGKNPKCTSSDNLTVVNDSSVCIYFFWVIQWAP